MTFKRVNKYVHNLIGCIVYDQQLLRGMTDKVDTGMILVYSQYRAIQLSFVADIMWHNHCLDMVLDGLDGQLFTFDPDATAVAELSLAAILFLLQYCTSASVVLLWGCNIQLKLLT